MLSILKRFALAMVIGIICNVAFFMELNEFVSSLDSIIAGTIVFGYDLGLIALMIKAYIDSKK